MTGGVREGRAGGQARGDLGQGSEVEPQGAGPEVGHSRSQPPSATAAACAWPRHRAIDAAALHTRTMPWEQQLCNSPGGKDQSSR